MRCFSIVFGVLGGGNPLDFYICVVSVSGGGVEHVCMAHSLIDLMMACIWLCASIQSFRGESCGFLEEGSGR